MAGVADSSGYGWAICKALAEAGATVTVGTWPPVLGIFEKSLKKGSFDEDMKLSDGTKFEIAKVRAGSANSTNGSNLCQPNSGLIVYTVCRCNRRLLP